MLYAIVTGDSRGFGEQIAKQFMEKGVHVIGISRKINESLKKQAEEQNLYYEHYSCDLSEPGAIKECMEKWQGDVFNNETNHVYLINNAGMIQPINMVGNLDADQMTKHLNLNMLAPMLLTDHLIRLGDKSDTSLTVVNITSGAAEKSMKGWSVYSSAKSGLNRFTKTAAEEQEQKSANAHTVIAFSPGVMDTGMQGEIREASEDQFADVKKFRQLKEEGKLQGPNTIAALLMDLLNNPNDLETGKVYKAYDLLDAKK
ncbi:(S)-benzoin forming benzil reductase [Thalassobacillus hwangdonensis]|uniref:(S)-benzoin forming benzil reductase n=1 Tax=Thalassobacillus hwangdonensis TaxID=546108 RepID=A0ABW3KVZ3_9BACI